MIAASSTLDPEALQRGRKLLTQVFDYLEAFNQLRNPAKRQIGDQPRSLWLRDLPNHPVIRRGDPAVATFSPDAPGLGDDDFVLQVDRPNLMKAPAPPLEIAAWLSSGWENVDGKVEIVPTRNVADARGDTYSERFEDDFTRPRSLATWKARRDAWVAAEKPARIANDVFEQLYELRAQIERESERIELIFGDGILDWQHPAGRVHHPVLLQRIALEFDASIPRFTLREADHPVELYSHLLHSLDGVTSLAIQTLLKEIADNPSISPAGGTATTGFLRGLVGQLSAGGRFLDAPEPSDATGDPHLWRDPVLFTRARNLGFGLALEGIREHLSSTNELPGPLLNIVGMESVQNNDADDRPPTSSRRNEDADILLTKPANGEQLQIARRLDQHGCVLVQGPPGTGKTHTIGNLIGHLLAQGKSILVTSHSVKALRVLREQVVEQLQPLCVSVLEAGGENRAELEMAINEIVNRLQGADADALDREAETLQRAHLDTLARLAKARQELKEARSDEYREVVLAGASWTPSDAARLVATGRSTDSWIPPTLAIGEPLPISADEVKELYLTNVTICAEDERELDLRMPALGQLVPPGEFASAVGTIERVRAEDPIGRPHLWENIPDSATPEALIDITNRLARAVESIQKDPGWRLAALSAGFSGGGPRSAWEDLVRIVREAYEYYEGAQTVLMRHGPSLPPWGSPLAHLAVAEAIVDHLDRGGNLGTITLVTRPTWRSFIAGARVNGQTPRNRDQFAALATLARVMVARSELMARWALQMAPHGAPMPDALAGCVQYLAGISNALTWWDDDVVPLIVEIKRLGFHWEAFLAEASPNPALGELERASSMISEHLATIAAARADRLRLGAAVGKIAALSAHLVQAGGQGSADVVNHLGDETARRDPNAYRSAYDHLVDLENRRSILTRRRELLSRLAPQAPAWAALIRSRCPPHDGASPPGDPVAAWRWRQLNDELARRAATSLDVLVREVERQSEILQKRTVELVDRRAWAAQRRRTKRGQQQALVGWQKVVSKIGKGTGKRAPILRAAARKLMQTARTAVPVWIMPLSRVVETYDPRTTRFDVVIIDEASQSDVMALCALYLGRTAVIVGDDQQVSPLAVGQQILPIQQLISAFLVDVPNPQLYADQSSVYDLAQTAFGGAVFLREHFRCVPEIIAFSNDLSYGGKIVPLRDGTGVRLRPATIAHRVDHAIEEKDVNRQEALEVASLLVAAVGQPEYETSSFGVISLLGDEQAREIDTLLRRNLTPAEYHRRRIICGNAAQFQGDERDVMFLSVVNAPKDGPLAMRSGGPGNLYMKRFNVAASRARDQLWVVHSLNPVTDLQPGDLRRRLIEHAQDPTASLRAQLHLRGKTQSPFEAQVLDILIATGYRVIPQHPVGIYRIDLVVEGGNGRLAIECDGDRFHTPENLPDDMERQALLERMGWTFVRIRGSEFFRDPEAAMKPVFSRLQELGISPEGLSRRDPLTEGADSELRDRVIRRAAELRREWTASAADSRAIASETAPVLPPEATTTDNGNPPPEARPSSRGRRQVQAEQAMPRESATQLPLEPSAVGSPAPPLTGDLPRGPVLRAIARNLGRDWRTCPSCGSRASLQHGPLGPYLDCFRPTATEPNRGRHPVPTEVINKALREFTAACPECGDSLVVPPGTFHQIVRCSARGCRFTINWEDFIKRPRLIQA